MASQTLGNVLQSLLRPVYEKTPHMSLMMDWPTIVGSEIAAYTWPIKIVSPKNSPGIAYIQSKPAFAIQAWSVSAILIERINQYLGYEAVSRIRLIKETLTHDVPKSER
jgi:hypothetical protein